MSESLLAALAASLQNRLNTLTPIWATIHAAEEDGSLD